ncbi:MAG: tauA [Acidobacteria bacterium]|nr:tauA [Acidobacteriota bacterium]
MNRRRFIALAGAFAGIGHVSCAQRATSNTIKISSNPYFAMSGLYLAQELGYFTDLGLKIEIERIATTVQAVPLAAAGKLDVVFCASSASLANAIAKGSRLRIVAGREIASPGCADLSVLYGRCEVFPEGLGNLGLLRGKRIGADHTATIGHFGLDMVLASAGMTAEELGVLKIGRSELLVAFLSGKLDAIIASDCGRRFAKIRDQIVTGIGLADVLPDYQISFVVFGARLLDNDPDTGVKFLSAYLRGAREYLAGKTPKFHDELAISNGMDPEEARKACRNTFVSNGQIDLPSIDHFVQWARAKGFCTDVISAEQLVDMRFLEQQQKYEAPQL